MRSFFIISYLCLLSILPAQQNYHILGIRVEFQLDQSDLTTGNGKFNLGNNSAPYQIDPPPHNKRYFEDHIRAVNDYFTNISTGNVNITGSIYPSVSDSAYLLPEKMAYYNPNLGDEKSNQGLAVLFRDALLAAANDQQIDFSNFNCFVVFHAGVGKDIAFAFDETPEDISSLYISPDFLEKYLGQRNILLRNGTVSIDRGIILPETESQAGIQLALNGIFASNMGSYLGLPDLFDVEQGKSAIGAFGLMDAGLFNFSGLLPARAMAWTRKYAGWEDPGEIIPGENITYNLSAVDPAIPASVEVKFSGDEYFLIEHRWNGNKNHDSLMVEYSKGRDTLMTAKEYLIEHLPGAADFDPVSGVLVHAENYDVGLPGSGLLIWRIDDRVIRENIDQNRINGDSKYRGISLIEADAAQDIGQQYDLLDGGYGSSLGYLLDFWYDGNPSPFYRNEFSSTSLPAANSHYSQAPMGIKLANFTAISSAMSFDIMNEFNIPGYPRVFQDQVYAHYSGNVIVLWEADSLRVFADGQQISSQPDPFKFNDTPEFVHFLSTPNYYLAAYTDKKIWLGKLDQNFSLLSSDSLLKSGIRYVALGDGVFTCINEDTLSQYQMTNSGLILMSIETFSNTPYPVYLESDLSIFDANINPNIVNADSIFHPVFEENSQSWWVLTKNGIFLRFDRDRTRTIVEKDLGVFPENQPVLGYNESSNQKVPAIFFINKEKIYGYNERGDAAENFPILLNDFGKSDGSEIRIGQYQDKNLFLAMNVNGAVLAASEKEAFIPDLSLKLEPGADYWLSSSKIENFSGSNTWNAFANGITSGTWNGEGGNIHSYKQNLISIYTNPENKIIEKNSAYNWPNPNLDNFTMIRVRLSESAKIKIRIIDMAAESVHAVTFDGSPGINEYKWDLTHISSGIYFANLTAYKNGKSESSLIKIMVVK